MKFILNENKNFLLEERFILQEAHTLEEASIAEVAQKWSAQLSDTFGNTELVLQKYKEFAGNHEVSSSKVKALKAQFDTATESLQTSLELPAAEIAEDLIDIKTELNNYIQILKQVLEKIKSSASNEDTLTLLGARIKKLETIYGKASWEASEIAQLHAILLWTIEQLKPVFDGASGHSETTIEEVKVNCTNCLELISQIKENLPEDFSKITAEDFKNFKDVIQKILEALKNIPNAEKITRVWVIQNLKTVQTQVQSLKELYSQLSKTSIIVQQMKDKAKATASTERTFAGYGDKDWKVKYAAAVNKSAVIEEFIYTTWKDLKEANKVLQIKEALKQECESFGFKPSDANGKNGNPFIYYISNIYLKYNINPAAYNVVHNLVANNIIKASDLVGSKDSSLGRGNLIFCKELYNQETSVIKLYLKKQNNLLKATKKSDTFNSIAEQTFNILYSLPEIVTGPQVTAGWSTNLKLNTMAAIEELETKWIGAVSDTPLDPNDKPEKAKTATNAELINQIKTPENAVKVLVALAAKFSSNDDLITVVESCAEAKQLMSKPTTFIEVQKLVASVERLYKLTNITATQALSLAKSIIEFDAFNLTKE